MDASFSLSPTSRPSPSPRLDLPISLFHPFPSPPCLCHCPHVSGPHHLPPDHHNLGAGLLASSLTPSSSPLSIHPSIHLSASTHLSIHSSIRLPVLPPHSVHPASIPSFTGTCCRSHSLSGPALTQLYSVEADIELLSPEPPLVGEEQRGAGLMGRGAPHSATPLYPPAPPASNLQAIGKEALMLKQESFWPPPACGPSEWVCGSPALRDRPQGSLAPTECPVSGEMPGPSAHFCLPPALPLGTVREGSPGGGGGKWPLVHSPTWGWD